MRRSSHVLKVRRVNRKGAKTRRERKAPSRPGEKPQITQIDADQNPCPQITQIPRPPGNTTEASIHRSGGVDTSAGIRGCAADSSCDVRLSASKLWSRSPSQLLPILWMGTGAIGSISLHSFSRGREHDHPSHLQGGRRHWRHWAQWPLEAVRAGEELDLRGLESASSGPAAAGRGRQCLSMLFFVLVWSWIRREGGWICGNLRYLRF